tara:strand:- start:724 stop:1086 length:363 start_codon:yes stop_codon:yes gene_type:complete
MERVNVDKLIEMREWIDENFPSYYKPYEEKFIKKAKSLNLDPFTLKAVKREFELRFNLNKVEWQLMHLLLHFSAMRQAGITSKCEDKKVDIEISGVDEENKRLIQRMVLLMWDVVDSGKD